MKYAVRAELVFSTVLERDKSLVRVRDYIATKTVWGDTQLWGILNEASAPTLILEVRFNTVAEQQELYNLAVGENWAGGELSYHSCTHDEGSGLPCTKEGVVIR